MRKNKKRFYTILIENYIAFTLVIVLSIICISSLSSYRIRKILSEPRVKELSDYASIISENEINDLDENHINKLVGRHGSIQILNKNNKIIFESKNKIGKRVFTKKEVSYIPNYYDNPYIDIQRYVNDNNEKNISVSITYYGDEDNIQNKIYVMDENLNLIYSNTSDKIKSFTDMEFKYLCGIYPKGYEIRKYKFYDKNNEPMTLLIYRHSISSKIIKKIDYTNILSFLGFILIYIVLIIIFIVLLNYKVKKPINILNEAIVEFKNGKRQNYLEYDGPQEFCDICDSFNDMSKKLYDSEQKRKKLEEDKQQMLADISHDLKTPITVIKGYSKAICDNLVDEDEIDQYLMTINRKADDLDELINTFHEYSKMDHPNYNFKFEKTDICEFTRIYLAQKYEELYLSGVEIEVDIPEEIIYCSIDKLQIKRVFDNLVSNAQKHNKNQISILFRVEKYEDKVKINIADNGYGIPEEIKNEIFDPFVVGEKSRTKKGSGLGLAISKKIIEAHKGSIKLVKPEENYNTEFEILLINELK